MWLNPSAIAPIVSKVSTVGRCLLIYNFIAFAISVEKLASSITSLFPLLRNLYSASNRCYHAAERKHGNDLF